MLLLAAVCIQAVVSVTGRLPLHSDKATEMDSKIPGCRLGNVFHEIEARWNPSMEPVGPMYCVQCTCAPVMKKGVLQRKGRVHCNNIKNKCPKLTCSDQWLPPKSCCKVCRNDPKGVTTWSTEDKAVSDTRFGENSHIQVFTSLLTGKGVPEAVATRGVARGYFTLTEGSFHYSVHYSRRLGSPTYIRFTDERGETYYQVPVVKTEQFKNRVCGVWVNMPGIYQKFLENRNLFVTLATDRFPNGEISGRVITHKALEEETFSGLLEPEVPDGSGAAAMMTLGRSGDDLSFVVMSDGLLAEGESTTITFLKDGKPVKNLKVRASSGSTELIEVWSSLTTQESRQLARGKLTMVVVSDNGREVKGDLTPKLTCNEFQGVLSGRESLEKSRTAAAGSAIITIGHDGRIHYKVRLLGLDSKVTGMTMEGAPNRKGRRKRVTKMIKDFKADKGSFDGWANGTFGKPNSREIYMLLREQLFIDVQTAKNQDSALRGRVTQLLYDDRFNRHTGHPFVMSGSNLSPPLAAGTAGHAWVAFDRACALNFEIVVSGLSREDDGTFVAEVGDVVNGKTYEKKIRGFTGSKVSGKIEDLSKAFFRHVELGQAYVQVSIKAHPKGVIRAPVQATAPGYCYRDATSSQYPDATGHILEDMSNNMVDEYVSIKCKYEGMLYEDGETWVPNKTDVCTTCSCKRGQTQCQAVICPAAQCDNPVTLPGECCPTCVQNEKRVSPSDQCYFPGDKKWHNADTPWHPYVHPFGFVVCAVCSCVPGKNEYNCTKLSCPPLTCSEQDAIRVRETDCCKVCPEVTAPPANSVVDQPKMQRDGTKAGCRVGESYYENGAEWNPRVHSLGAIKCVTCKCKNGNAKCRRPRCPKLSCRRKKKVEGSCCRVCSEDQSPRRGRRRKNRRKSSRQQSTQ
ncbi:chordin [Lingula anatina]|uniref:Chordin n=1 Tax=Lingula anatina TaxID=7574 RepID=A0A1S3HD08_LINAN|nr:chordin [Lingula anatina]|eukprot:XP_013383932.1 chordin [Lingula anatina]